MLKIVVVLFAASVVFGQIAPTDIVLGKTFPGCPRSNPNPTGCYCTTGCGVNSEAANPDGFAYKTPVWPPRAEPASYVGKDTICARITVPTRPTLLGKALVAWLGLGGDIFNNGTMLDSTPALGQQITIYTAFTQRQCSQFLELAQAVDLNDDVNRPSRMTSLRVGLCTKNNCNGPKPNPPPTKGLIVGETSFPGACPVSNKAKTGCFCTNGCAWNAEAGGFPWLAPSWPPVAYSQSFVGSDTICARITVPIFTGSDAADALVTALGINGDVMKDNNIVNNAGPGTEVTVYTAFTAAQCAEFQQMASQVALHTKTGTAKNLGIYFCNMTNCNSISFNRITRTV